MTWREARFRELSHRTLDKIAIDLFCLTRPSLISYGSHLALHHIDGEPSTNDGKVYNPLKADAPSILGEFPVIRAVDGLQFASRDAL